MCGCGENVPVLFVVRELRDQVLKPLNPGVTEMLAELRLKSFDPIWRDAELPL